jgi:hypothetical protein
VRLITSSSDERLQVPNLINAYLVCTNAVGGSQLPKMPIMEQQLQSLSKTMQKLTWKNRKLMQSLLHNNTLRETPFPPGKEEEVLLEREEKVENLAASRQQTWESLRHPTRLAYTELLSKLEVKIREMRAKIEEVLGTLKGKAMNFVDELVHKTYSHFSLNVILYPFSLKFCLSQLETFYRTRDPLDHLEIYKMMIYPMHD